MAYQQHGNLDYVFGFNDANAEALATSIGIKPQTLSISGEPEFTAEAKNEDGETESFVVGADAYNFTLSGFLVDESAFNAATNFTFDSRYFIVVGRKRDKSNTDFQKAEFTGRSFPLITS